MTEPTLTRESRLESFKERVVEHRIGACRLLLLRTSVKSVVTWRGSFKSLPAFAENEDLVQNLTVSLLDKGTRHRDRFEIAAILEGRGSEVSFSSDGLYVDLSGRALKNDIGEVLRIVTEELMEPLLDEAEFEKARARANASLRRSLESTSSQAGGVLSRRIYPPDHPNFIPEPATRLKKLESISVDDVRRFHQQHFGAHEFTLALVGDLDEDRILEEVRHSLGDWKPHDIETPFSSEPIAAEPGRSVIPMPDKQNVDVRIGHPVDVMRHDPRYIPLYIAVYILGGNFSARLMQVIRDEKGLTYGIRSSLSGISTEYKGHFQIGVTLSEANVEVGINETVAEVRRFVHSGVTAEELEEKKTTITGAFKVGLATTGGLAAALLKNAERGFTIDYLDRFPDEITAVTLEEVNEAVREHLDPDKFQYGLAGKLLE